MRYIALLVLLSMALVITGCGDACNSNSPDDCNRSCETDEDCIQACPIGCINENESYEQIQDTDCTQVDCRCENSTCQPSP